MSTKGSTAVTKSEKNINRELNILFTCAGRRVALMEAFRRAMAELGVAGKILATDITMSSPAFHKADKGLIVPPVGTIEHVAALREAVQKNKIGLIVPLTDLDLRILARHSESFAKDGCTVMVGGEEIIMTLRDKAKTNRMLANCGLEAIRTLTLADFIKTPFYPCFIKPVKGSAGIGTAVVHSERELRHHVAVHGEKMIVQEFAAGQEFTVDVYKSRAGKVMCVVPRQRLVVRSGEVEKAITVKDDELIAAATKLAAGADGMWGVFCCQCRRQPGHKPKFFEVNPRFGGGCVLSIAAGANLPLYLLQDVLGLPITAKMGQFTDRLLMLRYDDAAFVPFDNSETLPGIDTPIFR